MKKVSVILMSLLLIFEGFCNPVIATGRNENKDIPENLEYVEKLEEAIYWIEKGTMEYSLVKVENWVDVTNEILFDFSSQIEKKDLIEIVDYMNENGIAIVKGGNSLLPYACIGDDCPTAGSKTVSKTGIYTYQNPNIPLIFNAHITFSAKCYVKSSGAFVSWDSVNSSLSCSRIPSLDYENLALNNISFDFTSSVAKATFTLYTSYNDGFFIDSYNIGTHTITLQS